MGGGGEGGSVHLLSTDVGHEKKGGERGHWKNKQHIQMNITNERIQEIVV